MADESFKFIHEHQEAITHLADGTSIVEGTVFHNGMEPEEVRQAAAEVHGIDPENVVIKHVEGEPYDGTSRSPQRRVGKMSVAFSASKWRSSWDPHADPTQN